MSTLPVAANILYLVRNKLQADILLPYPSLDEHPKDILWSGQCMFADKRLVQALEGWLEVLDTIPQPNVPANSTVTINISEFNYETEGATGALLQSCWQRAQGKYLKVWQIAGIASCEARALLKGVDPESREARVAIGLLLRKLSDHNPPGWTVCSRKRSHTIEYRIVPSNL